MVPVVGLPRERAGDSWVLVPGCPLITAHTSGHATVPDLRRLVSAIDPGRVVPIHTDAPTAFVDLFPRATPVADGDWWTV